MSVILSIAGTTVGEAIRRRVLLVILLIALGSLVIVPGLSVLQPRGQQAAITSLTMGIIQMTSALIAIVLTVYMIPNEIDRRTIYTILCKPVHRWQFLVGKYLGAVAALAMMIFFMTLVLIAVTSINRGFDIARVQELVKGPFMYFWQMSILAAVAMLFSTFVTPLVNFFLSSGIFIAGTVFSSIFQSFMENRGTGALTRTLASVAQYLIPNFALYNVQNPIINPGQEIVNEFGYYLQSIGYAALYISGLLLIAILIFDRREV